MSLLSGLLPPEFIIDEQRLVGGNGDVSRRFLVRFALAKITALGRVGHRDPQIAAAGRALNLGQLGLGLEQFQSNTASLTTRHCLANKLFEIRHKPK